MKLAIVIPAYNEEETIEKVLKSLPIKIQGVDEIISIVINDGSSDKTSEIARKYASKVVDLAVNLGVGSATEAGMIAARRLGADIVVTMDADGQHNASDIKKIIGPILTGKADVVIGTRMLNSHGMPWIRVFGNWAMSILTFLIFHQWTSDSQSGMRAFGKNAIAKINHRAIGYEICSETIGEIKRNNLRLKEVPIDVIYSKYSVKKGQNIFNSINILTKIIIMKITRR